MESLFWVWSYLWSITATTPQIPSFAHSWLVPNYCTLAGIDYYKKVFLLHFPSRVMGSAMGDTSGRAATSFWKTNSLFSAPFEEGSSCVLSQTHLHWEGSEHCSPLCHQFEALKQELCKCSNYFKSRKWKEHSKVLVGFEQGTASELFTVIPHTRLLFTCSFRSLDPFFFLYLFFLTIYSRLLQTNIH